MEGAEEHQVCDCDYLLENGCPSRSPRSCVTPESDKFEDSSLKNLLPDKELKNLLDEVGEIYEVILRNVEKKLKTIRSENYAFKDKLTEIKQAYDSKVTIYRNKVENYRTELQTLNNTYSELFASSQQIPEEASPRKIDSPLNNQDQRYILNGLHDENYLSEDKENIHQTYGTSVNKEEYTNLMNEFNERLRTMDDNYYENLHQMIMKHKTTMKKLIEEEDCSYNEFVKLLSDHLAQKETEKKNLEEIIDKNGFTHFGLKSNNVNNLYEKCTNEECLAVRSECENLKLQLEKMNVFVNSCEDNNFNSDTTKNIRCAALNLHLTEDNSVFNLEIKNGDQNYKPDGFLSTLEDRYEKMTRMRDSS